MKHKSPHKAFLSLESLQDYMLTHATIEECLEQKRIFIEGVWITSIEIFLPEGGCASSSTCEFQPLKT